jgi:hypothetical protein
MSDGSVIFDLRLFDSHQRFQEHNSGVKQGFGACYSRDQLKKNEMGGECGTYGRAKRCIQGFGGET